MRKIRENILWLIFAHGIGDLGLQTNFIAQNKAIIPTVMLGHSIIVSGCIALALRLLGKYSNIKFILLIETHFLIDFISKFFVDYMYYNMSIVNFFDQLAHLGIILFVYFYRKE